MKQAFILIIFCLVISGFVFGQQESYYGALLILNVDNNEEMKMTIKEIEDANGKIIHRYPPNIVIGKFPGDILKELTNWHAIREVITSLADETEYTFLSETGVYALQAWNNNFMDLSKSRGLDEPPRPDATPLSNCIIMETPMEEVPNLPGRSNAPEGAAFEDVSEFLQGSISVAVILTESDGTNDPSTEDWSAAREAQCVSEIQNGFNWLANQNPDANLSFTYHFYYGRTNPDAQTQWEPITHNPGFDFNWQNEILAKFGYSGNRLTKHYSLLNDIIESDDTNWGAVIWLVDSKNDDDGRFADSTVAYTGGIGYPYSVMSYKNGPWGISNMDLVTVHEFQHQFYAHDEYASASWYTDCTTRAGYLNIQNQNFDNDCLLDEFSCTMRSFGFTINGSTTCFYTHGHDGWYDDDSDGIPNILDTSPIVNLDPIPPDPIYTKLLPGNIDINPLPNQNPLGNGNDITLNKIDEFQFKAGSGLPWRDGIILNQANDFVIGPIGDGTHTVNVKATNSVGNVSQTETFTAEFQTHLKSLSPTALTHNGGRKVWTNPDWDEQYEPGYQMVYEDNGDIYFTEYWRTFSQPYEYYWSNEHLLSDGSGNSSNPSIASFNDGYVPCVVWQQYDPSINKYIIKYWADWQPPVALDTTTTTAEPQPVVGAYFVNDGGGAEYSWHFVWNDGSGLKYAVLDDYGNTYTYDIDETDANCHNPTITDNWYNPNLGIAWDKNGDIYYQEVDLIESEFVGTPVNVSCGIVLYNCFCFSKAIKQKGLSIHDKPFIYLIKDNSNVYIFPSSSFVFFIASSALSFIPLLA